jgi:hypothetical protein
MAPPLRRFPVFSTSYDSVENGNKSADKVHMSPSSITNNSFVQSILNTALQATGLSGSTKSSSASATSSQQADNGQLSPFAQLMSELQQLQQSNPTQYQQVTKQIASNLQNAAQTATSEGNSTAANQLNTLATDFTNASQSGQLPNVSDLAAAIGGGGHHHHHGHHGGGSSSSSTDSSSSTSPTSSTGSTSSTSTSSSSSPLQQLLSAFESNATQNESLNPLSIITSTLANAGIGSTNS